MNSIFKYLSANAKWRIVAFVVVAIVLINCVIGWFWSSEPDIFNVQIVAEEKARLEKAGIKYILSCWIDMLGLPKTKPIPFAEFEALGLTDLELRKEVNELRNATNQLKLVFQRNV